MGLDSCRVDVDPGEAELGSLNKLASSSIWRPQVAGVPRLLIKPASKSLLTSHRTAPRAVGLPRKRTELKHASPRVPFASHTTLIGEVEDVSLCTRSRTSCFPLVKNGKREAENLRV